MMATSHSNAPRKRTRGSSHVGILATGNPVASNAALTGHKPYATSSQVRVLVSASPIRVCIDVGVVGQLDERLGSKIDQEDIDRLRIVEVAAEHDR